ncbi:MAG TPA: hypothetical protein VFE62_28245 [Gemmataceae bacterium]|nr:hypothetical protein [Gemmataceae bacterium]
MSVDLVYDGVPVAFRDGPYVVAGKPTEDAIAFVESLAKRMDQWRTFAADELLAFYNDTCLDEEIGILGRTGFAAQLDSSAIVIDSEIGSAEVHFEDGGLFAGQFVIVIIKGGHPIKAEVVG